MTIKEFKTEEKDKWNAFVAQNPFFHILQTWEWGEVKRGKSWKVLRLGVFHKNQQMAAAQILIRHLPLHLRLYYCPYGPVIDWEMPYGEEVLENIKTYLTDLSDNRHLFLKIEPTLTNEQAKQWKIDKMLKKIGFKRVNPSIQPQHTTIVDLKKTEEELLSTFEKDTRYSIRRAYKEEVEVKEFKNPLNNQPLKEFYSLYQKTAKRGKFPGRSWSHFARLWEEMCPHQVRCYQAWFKNKLLAAALVLTLGHKAYLVYAGSVREEEYKNKFPTYLLQWETMRSLKKEGFLSYDLWGVIPEIEKDHPWAGISLFKRGFRGKEVNYLGSFDLPLSPFYRPYQFINGLRYYLSGRNLNQG